MNILNENIDIREVIYLALKEKIGSSINYQEVHSMIGNVIEERRDEFEKLLNKCLDKVFKDKEFEQVILDEFRHKVAKNMVAKLEGSIEKNIQKFRMKQKIKDKIIAFIGEDVKCICTNGSCYAHMKNQALADLRSKADTLVDEIEKLLKQ